jgi:hypothetical protein
LTRIPKNIVLKSDEFFFPNLSYFQVLFYSLNLPFLPPPPKKTNFSFLPQKHQTKSFFFLFTTHNTFSSSNLCLAHASIIHQSSHTYLHLSQW